MPVVRISRGTFSADAFDEVAARLDESQRSLVPAIEQLSGIVSYYAGADADSNPMINVSVWKSIGAVNQMAILPEMFALAGEVFERAPFQPMPISNPLQNDERQPSLRPLLIGTSSGGDPLLIVRLPSRDVGALFAAGSARHINRSGSAITGRGS